MLDTLKKLESGTLKPICQNSNHSTYAPKLKKEDGLIDWNQSAFQIHNRVRGLLPWPGTYSFWGSRRFQICKTEIKTTRELNQPGIIFRLSDIGIEVGTANGIIIITELQPEGKKRMHVKSFLSGHKLVTGRQFTKKPLT
jgi:methionyl-tRNA formyltransferase